MTGLFIVGAVGWVERKIRGKVLVFPGGAAFNIGLAAKRRGLNVSIVSLIGEDSPLLGEYDGLGSHCRMTPGKTARFIYKTSTPGSEPVIDCEYGVLSGLAAHACSLFKVYRGTWIHVCCRAPIDPGRILSHILRLGPARVSLDFIYSSLPTMLEAAAPFLSKVDYIFMNAAEFDLSLRSRHLDEFNGHLIVTRGDKGALMIKRGRLEAEICGLRVRRVLDASGAGDTFAGTFIAESAFGEPFLNALETANSEAAKITERIGMGV